MVGVGVIVSVGDLGVGVGEGVRVGSIGLGVGVLVAGSSVALGKMEVGATGTPHPLRDANKIKAAMQRV
jgi:hypothetical protein